MFLGSLTFEFEDTNYRRWKRQEEGDQGHRVTSHKNRSL